jgi:hypothetical protein
MSGWRRYVQAAKLKASRPNFSGFSAPRHQRVVALAPFSLKRKGGMEMPSYDFKQPASFLNALEQFSLALECVMAELRNEAMFHDNGDHAMVNAAHQFCEILEDRHAEALTLADALERRVLEMAS